MNYQLRNSLFSIHCKLVAPFLSLSSCCALLEVHKNDQHVGFGQQKFFAWGGLLQYPCNCPCTETAKQATGRACWVSGLVCEAKWPVPSFFGALPVPWPLLHQSVPSHNEATCPKALRSTDRTHLFCRIIARRSLLHALP